MSNAEEPKVSLSPKQSTTAQKEILTIYRAYYDLMIYLGESPLLRKKFANERFVDGKSVITQTEDTIKFLTTGYSDDDFFMPGVGMRIPEDAKIVFDPNTVWPTVTLEYTSGDVIVDQSANTIAFEQETPSGSQSQSFEVDENSEEGDSLGTISVKGGTLKCVTVNLPYLSPHFDILMDIEVEDENGKKESILLTT